MFAVPQWVYVLVLMVLVALALRWDPPNDWRTAAAIVCYAASIPIGWFLGLAVLALLDSFAVVPSAIQLLVTVVMLVALARVVRKASNRAGLLGFILVAVIAALLPVWTYGL